MEMDRLSIELFLICSFLWILEKLRLSDHRLGFIQREAIIDMFYGFLESWKHLSFSNKQKAFKDTQGLTTNCGEKPLSILCLLLEDREIVGFCHSCSILYVIDTSCLTGSKTPCNIEEGGYNCHSYFLWAEKYINGHL